MHSTPLLVLVATTAAFISSLVHAQNHPCHGPSIPHPQIFGLRVLSITATEHHNYTWSPFPPDLSNPDSTTDSHAPLAFCNITVTYTHPNLNDTIHTYIWLPVPHDWNGRFLGVGGGGYAAGTEAALPPALSRGYAVANTDAGHSIYLSMPGVAVDSSWWSLASPGNTDWIRFQNFGARALGDLPRIAKQVITAYYGRAPKYSYWTGCSTGGRQGLMSAQRYPGDYDGILAAAPAINFETFVAASMWPQVAMRTQGYAPPRCEMDAIRAAAILACDGLDGVEDGVVSAPGLCTFDARKVVGMDFECEGAKRKISAAAAEVVNQMWAGPKREGREGWFGITHETAASIAELGAFGGLGNTECDSKNERCKGVPFPLCADWVKNVVMKGDPEFDIETMDEEQFWTVLHRSRNEFKSIIGTSDADLLDFKTTGAKIVMWHGLADQLIFPNGSVDYYERVEAADPTVRDYFRLFLAPGVEHCVGGDGPMPIDAFEAVVKWVEDGIPPDSLSGANVQKGMRRPLCPYPLVAAYKGGDVKEAASYECAESFEKFADRWEAHMEL